MEGLKESLEERLVEHDNRRVEVQDKIKERGARALETSIRWRGGEKCGRGGLHPH